MPALVTQQSEWFPDEVLMVDEASDDLNRWADAMAKPECSELTASAGGGAPAHRPQPAQSRRSSGSAGLKAVVAAMVFATSIIFGTSLFLFQTRPDLMAHRASTTVLQSAIAFIVVIMLALTLFRLIAMDRPQRPPGPAAASSGKLPETLVDVGETMDNLADRSAELEERLSILSRQLEWNARKNVAALQAAATAAEAQLATIEFVSSASDQTLGRLVETARQFNALACALRDNLWAVNGNTNLSLDAGSRYIAERLRHDPRSVVDDALGDFETRARNTIFHRAEKPSQFSPGASRRV